MERKINRYRKPKRKIIIPQRVQERAATRYIVDSKGCWISTYSTASHGYAQIGWDNGKDRNIVTAHRAAWVYHNGRQIPEGYVIDHLCKSRRCVNPDHLRCITNFENARRTWGKDWKVGECANGHPNSELYWDGQRFRCKPCTLEYQRRHREKKRRMKQQAHGEAA